MKKYKKTKFFIVLLILLTSCAGEQVGDSFETENEICTTTMEYKWVWSFFEDSGFKKVPVTKCRKVED